MVAGFLLAALVIAYKVFQTSVIDGDMWREKGNAMYRKYMPIEAERGSLLAEDGRPLAVSQPFFEIRMDLTTSSQKDFDKYIDSLAECIVKDLHRSESPGAYADLLRHKRVENNKYFLIKKRVSYDQLERIKKYPLFSLSQFKGGLIVEDHTTRFKPYNILGSRTVGLVRDNGNPVGLEGAYDEELRGKTGKRLMQKIAGNTWVPVKDLSGVAPERGNDIVTTLDVDLQDIVHHCLIDGIKKHQAEFGTAILMDVKTGGIKAISNISKTSEGGYWETYNYAVGWNAEPGSTFKTAAVLAMFEDDAVEMDSWVNLQKGSANFYGQIMRDSRAHGIEGSTLRKAFQMSSNIGVATLADRYYNNKRNAEQFISRLKQFGLDQKTGVEILGEPKPFIKNAFDYNNHWSKTSIAWMSHGYELQITPLQLLSFYAAIANKGKRMKPFLVSEVRSGEQIVKQIKPKVVKEQIASEASLKKIDELLVGVVEDGSGRNMKSEMLALAAKTGTAKVDYFKKDAKAKYLSSVAGYFPADDPVYACVVFIGQPTKDGYYGGTVAGPIFKEIAEKCYLSRIAIAKAINEGPRPSLQDFQLPKYNVGYKKDFQYLLEELDVEYKLVGSDDWVVLVPDEKQVHLKNRKIEKSKVPNVLGMGAKDAIYILEQYGLDVVMRGHGKVKEQSIEPGSSVSGVSKIYIKLG